MTAGKSNNINNGESAGTWIAYLSMIIGLLALSGGVYLLYDYYRAQKMAANGDEDETSKPVTTNGTVASVINSVKNTVASAVTPTFPLQYGSMGPEVETLQKYLNQKFNAGLDPDGVFGSRTKAALILAAGTSSVSQAEYNRITAELNRATKTTGQNKYGNMQTNSLVA